MLKDLQDLQRSDESIQNIDVSFDVNSRYKDSGEIIQSRYTFSYTSEWDKWMFTEYKERRTPDTESIKDRNWSKSRHITWDDTETPTINVPPEIFQKLAEATEAESVTIQIPRGSFNENQYKEFMYDDEE